MGSASITLTYIKFGLSKLMFGALCQSVRTGAAHLSRKKDRLNDGSTAGCRMAE